jgi:hypothetical protein
MHRNIATRPTQLAEVIPLPPMAEGPHNASGTGTGGIWFPGPLLRASNGYDLSTLVVWRHRWPQQVISRLVTDSNPRGSITNSDLELAGGLLHLNALSNCFNIPKRTVLSQHYILGMEWEARLPQRPRHTSFASLGSTNASIATFQDSTTSLEPPTMSPMHSCNIFTYLGLTCLPHCLTIFPRRLVVNFAPHQSTLFQP